MKGAKYFAFKIWFEIFINDIIRYLLSSLPLANMRQKDVTL